ncbi:MAG: efflux RND transporter periplasmic adaptor subunit, partial [Armatimonadetes bacterium]|nr:efflux RND transporter periplasmic adaptor subunit [Armatimonadota bacterium]
FYLAVGILLLLLLGFTLYRMRRTGQQVTPKAVLNRQVIGGLLLMALMFAVSVWAVGAFRRKGAMTPIEGQAMEMSTPAPPGVTTVELAAVERGEVANTVSYTGSAVANTEVKVYPRVAGWIEWMPLYAGDRVRKGQVLARLDTSQVEPEVAERRAGVNMAQQGVGVARQEHRQALSQVNQARAELGAVQGAVEEARANLDAAQEERRNAEAQLTAARSEVTDARAQMQAARADLAYWEERIERMRTLVKEGAVSREEFQQEQAQAETARAKVRQAQAAINGAQAGVRAAQAQLRKSDAMIQAARTKIRQSNAGLIAQHAQVRSMQAAAETARKRIEQAKAGEEQSRAALGGATTARGYAEIRSPVEGVVTERLLSPGVLVNPGQAVLEIAEIRPIRLQANVAETDLNRIQVGARVLARDQDPKQPPIVTKVTSITPAVDPRSRTGIVEALHPNRDARFVPGEFVTMEISTGVKEDTLWIPTRAVRTETLPSGRIQSTQTSAYVWVAEPAAGGESEYTVRPVNEKTGLSNGVKTEILFGLEEGQQVVVEGYQNLREGGTVRPIREMLAGGAPPGPPERADAAGEKSAAATGEEETPKSAPAQETSKEAAAAVQTASVSLTDQGYQPASVSLRQGVPARITFVRKTDATCGQEVVFPEYNIKKDLPLNEPVTVAFTPKKTGEVKFTCGMDMLRGKVVVR